MPKYRLYFPAYENANTKLLSWPQDYTLIAELEHPTGGEVKEVFLLARSYGGKDWCRQQGVKLFVPDYTNVGGQGPRNSQSGDVIVCAIDGRAFQLEQGETYEITSVPDNVPVSAVAEEKCFLSRMYGWTSCDCPECNYAKTGEWVSSAQHSFECHKAWMVKKRSFECDEEPTSQKEFLGANGICTCLVPPPFRANDQLAHLVRGRLLLKVFHKVYTGNPSKWPESYIHTADVEVKYDSKDQNMVMQTLASCLNLRCTPHVRFTRPDARETTIGDVIVFPDGKVLRLVDKDGRTAEISTLKFKKIEVDPSLIGHTSNPEYEPLKQDKHMDALRDRTIEVIIPKLPPPRLFIQYFVMADDVDHLGMTVSYRSYADVGDNGAFDSEYDAEQAIMKRIKIISGICPRFWIKKVYTQVP